MFREAVPVTEQQSQWPSRAEVRAERFGHTPSLPEIAHRPGKRGRLPPRLTDEETGGPERLPRQSTVTQRVNGRTRTGHGLQARPPASCHSVTRENEDAVPQATPVTEAGQKCTLLEPRASVQRHLLLTSPGLASPAWALVGQ